MNAILKAESTELLGAERYEQSEERKDSRNGTRELALRTRIGKLTLEVPRRRNVPFKTLVFDNYRRSEGTLITAMDEMVVNGVSSRKAANVMEMLRLIGSVFIEQNELCTAHSRTDSKQKDLEQLDASCEDPRKIAKIQQSLLAA